MSDADRQKSNRWLEELQRRAYLDQLGYPPPVFPAEEVGNRGEATAEILREGGALEAELVQETQQEGRDPALARAFLQKISQGSAQVLAHHNVDRVLFEYRDAPTPHVDPFHHMILKRTQADIEAIPRFFSQDYPQRLGQLRGRVTLSTLPTGQFNAKSITVPETDQVLILFDPSFFDLLYFLSNDFARAIHPEKMQQEAIRYMRTAEWRPLGESIRYADYSPVLESFFWTLSGFLEEGRSPFPLPYDEAIFDLAEHLRNAAALFIAAHEYAHILLGHLQRKNVALNSAHSAQHRALSEELAADQLAFGIVNAALTVRRFVAPARFMGITFFFLCAMLLGLGVETLLTGRSVYLEDLMRLSNNTQARNAHPMPWLRLGRLDNWQKNMFPPDEYRGMHYHAAVLVEVAASAWRGIRQEILRMHDEGIKPPAMWTGWDIFEHPEPKRDEG